MKFAENFNHFVCPGDSITTEHQGFTLTATIIHDQDSGINDDDCHNPDQSVTGCNDEQFKHLLAARESYFRDEWWYCGIVISVSKNGVDISDHAGSLWGIEANYPNSDNSYLTDTANDMLDEAVEAAKTELARIRLAVA